MEPQIRNWEITGRDPKTGKFILKQVDENLLHTQSVFATPPLKPVPQKQPKKKLSETGYRAGITFGNDMEACKKTPTTTNQTPKTPPPTPTTSGNDTTFEVLKVTGMRGRTLLTLHSLDGTTDVLVDTMETPKNITLSKEGAAMVYANTQSTTPIVLNQQYIISML